MFDVEQLMQFNFYFHIESFAIFFTVFRLLTASSSLHVSCWRTDWRWDNTQAITFYTTQPVYETILIKDPFY